MSVPDVTAANVAEILQNDRMVKVAGIDVDGQLRGKLMQKSKFLSIVSEGFGFCSVIFGWDQHDMTYYKELSISNKENGYRDLVAVPDLSSFRRIPWESNVPFFLVSFLDPDTREPVCACPRGLLKSVSAKAEAAGYRAMAGGMFNGNAFFLNDLTSPADVSQPSMNSTSSGHRATIPAQNVLRLPQRLSCRRIQSNHCHH
jgi:glutamine synthetase